MPHCRADVTLPVAESISARGINLPSYPDLTSAQLDRIVGAITSFYR
jgi:perosamine synthetase